MVARNVLAVGDELLGALLSLDPNNRGAAQVAAQLPFVAWFVGFSANNPAVPSGVTTNFPLTSGFGSHPDMYRGGDVFYYPWPGMYLAVVLASFATNTTGARRLYINQTAPVVSQQIWSGPPAAGTSTQAAGVTNWGISAGFEGFPNQPGVQHAAGVNLAVSNVRVLNVFLGPL